MSLLAYLFAYHMDNIFLSYIDRKHEPPKYIELNDTLQISPFADGKNWYLEKDLQ